MRADEIKIRINQLFLHFIGTQCEVNMLSLVAPGLYVVNPYCNFSIPNSLPELASNASKWFASLFEYMYAYLNNGDRIYLGFKLRMLIMDCPTGCTCRLRGTATAEFSGKEESLGSDFTKAYQLIWKAKVKKIVSYFIH